MVQKSGVKTGLTEGKISAHSATVFNDLPNWMWNKGFSYELFKGVRPQAAMNGLFMVEPRDSGDKGDSGSLIIGGPDKALDDFVDCSSASAMPTEPSGRISSSLSMP